MIAIRKATAAEMPIITELAERIWPQNYSEYISEAQLRYMLNKMYNQQELLAQHNNGYTFFIASEANEDVGFACVAVLDEDEQSYKLHKLYVLSSMHGKGLGKLLVNQAVNLVVAQGGKSLQLNVNRNNKATNFYLKMGFNIKETVDIAIGDGFYMNDYVMELPTGS